MEKPIADYVKKRFAIDDLTSSLRLLRLLNDRGEVTQAQGAEAMGLSIGTCSLHFQKLEHIGLIHRAHTITKGKGRSTTIWKLDKENNFYLLLMFDTPFFQASLVDFEGNVVLEKCEDLTGITNVAAIEEQVNHFTVTAISHAKATHGHIRQTMAGVPGILNPHSGAVINAVNFPVLNGLDLESLMRQRHGLPCHCGSVGLALYHGETQHLPPDTRAMVLNWDLGIGAVAGAGERVISHASKDSLLSELGHIGIVRNGKLCHCGRRGCLEAYTGGWAMIEALADRRIQSLETFSQAVLDGQAAAMAVAEEAAYTFGKNIIWPLQIMQANRIIVSGLLSNIFPVVRDRFIEGLGTFFTEDEISALNPVASTDVSRALQHGAFRCARRQLLYPDG
ncbi:MAG: hypothetical protein DRP64_11065 [Verrucomicrobia bacterium]|nr:MAG: hypothetical protein DRP64_11065 [Verrucomicrobiota bacterium]